jgi:hypothetical protein
MEMEDGDSPSGSRDDGLPVIRTILQSALRGGGGVMPRPRDPPPFSARNPTQTMFRRRLDVFFFFFFFHFFFSIGGLQFEEWFVKRKRVSCLLWKGIDVN